MMKISDFDYELPESSIALYPPKIRGTTRLMVLNRQTGAIEHKRYSDFADYVKPGDVVVLNNTKVIKARLATVNDKGQTRELLLLEKHKTKSEKQHKVLYRGKIAVGELLYVAKMPVKIEHILGGGLAVVSCDVDLLELAAKHGSVPLPPYLHRDATEADINRYQTEFAKSNGSVAAPTASLNFTNDLIKKLEAKGGKVVYLTLHVGLGTFLPIRSDEVEGHKMHSEYFEIPAGTVEAIRTAKQLGHKVFAIGTTVSRTLEYAANEHPGLIRHSRPDRESSQKIVGEANIFIYPGFEFKIVDALLTNFHAPRSTVLMMAAAFSGWDNLKHAYTGALAQGYKFLSYGDSMLIF